MLTNKKSEYITGFWGIFLLLAIIFPIFHSIGLENEYDVLAVAKHFMNPDWVDGDWYLSQPIGYRYMFNYIVGFLIKLLPVSGIYIIRLLIILLYAYVFYELKRTFKLNLVSILAAIIIFSFRQYISAGEWMIGAIESKTFAYAFVLLALTSAYSRKYFKMWAFLGLSLSFHLLVGGYGAFITGLWLLYFVVCKGDYKVDTLTVLKSSWIYIITGILGLYAILSYLNVNSDIDGGLATKIYNWRVGHHSRPLYRGNNFNIVSLGKFLVSMATLYIVFVIVKVKKLNSELRDLTLFAVISTILIYLGFYANIVNNLSLSKLYLYRFPDTIVLLVLFLVSAEIFYQVVIRFIPKRICFSAIVLLAVVLFIPVKFSLLTDNKVVDQNVMEYEKWVNSTLLDALFLINPYDQPDFYFRGNRSRFVSGKHSPQTDEYIIEWYERLTYCNGGTLPDLKQRFTDGELRKMYNLNFESLSLEQLKQGSANWGFDYYIVTTPRIDLTNNLVFSNDKYYIYSLAGLKL